MATPHEFNCKIYYERIFDEIERARDYRLPTWQRPYVWEYEHRLALVHSFLERIPTGFIVLWKNSDEPYQNSPYVLDGQQRLTTLIRMFDSDETDPTFGLSLNIDNMTIGPGVNDEKHVQLSELFDLSTIYILLKRPRMFELVKPLCDVHDLLRRSELGVMTITGDEDYARTVYTRMNAGGVAHDPSQFRAPADVFTMANHVETMRATSA